jgi:hypothetical protein
LNLENLITKYYLILAETFASISYLEKNFLVKKVGGQGDPLIMDVVSDRIILRGIDDFCEIV